MSTNFSGLIDYCLQCFGVVFHQSLHHICRFSSPMMHTVRTRGKTHMNAQKSLQLMTDVPDLKRLMASFLTNLAFRSSAVASKAACCECGRFVT